MKLHDFLRNADDRAAPTKPATFKIVGKNKQGVPITAEASAQLAFVDEEERRGAENAADLELRKEYDGRPIPQGAREQEEAYQVLCLALRDSGDVRVQFAASAKELRRSMVWPVALELIQQYAQFVADEFPPEVDPETFKSLVEEAKKKSLADLLTSSDSSQIRRVLPSLVAHFGRFATPASTATAPA